MGNCSRCLNKLLCPNLESGKLTYGARSHHVRLVDLAFHRLGNAYEKLVHLLGRSLNDKFDSSVGDKIEGRDPLCYPRRMVGSQLNDTVTEANVLGSLAGGGQW